MRREKEVGGILRSMGQRIETLGLNTYQLRVLSSIRRCRTAALGGHVDACTECGIVRMSYNSFIASFPAVVLIKTANGRISVLTASFFSL
jgi:hypothetical protein